MNENSENKIRNTFGFWGNETAYFAAISHCALCLHDTGTCYDSFGLAKACATN